MAVALQSFVSLRNPNPSSYGAMTPRPLSRSPLLQFAPLPVRFRPGSILSSSSKRDNKICILSSPRLISRVYCVSAPHEESKHSDIGPEEKRFERESNEPEEDWQKILKTFKEEAIKRKNTSLDAYAKYSKVAMAILKETSVVLKIQADQAKNDLMEIVHEINEEGQGYLSSSPDSVKEIVEAFSSPNDLKEISKLQDFHVGIPYGFLLAIGGFLWFMLTGSISAIRFGVILGVALFALSLQSLRLSKSGQSSALLLKSQAAIVAIIFMREWRLYFQKSSFPGLVMTLVSGAVVAFYIYKILTIDKGDGTKLAESE
ncbi:protein FATTY ACID EXPORT 3, chloroplastic [Dioscorea cayenensis subsp. rotundata]|uniref:Protein FATTY ACID EXPORT 3, chloroplastic n=1 Tax=Dioscorea cayennensis subsp. rotundata TaxID=55577 RepID=A0AB40BZH5_DIOCR|nr:protein FATTY ACID EXPORT 3, chloroplastic [Dioscorea cayenensis subsp. rotundata]